MDTILDNPIWNALNSEHRAVAVGDGLARRYAVEIGPLSGLAEQSDAAYEDLRALAAADGMSAQFLHSPAAARPGWELLREGAMSQMVWSGATVPEGGLLGGAVTQRRLTGADVTAMVELAELTEPGPFRARTHELGAFFGIFESERLVAMAGQRMRWPGFVELSAVCTRPEVRGRGYARSAMCQVMAEILGAGAVPVLHVFLANAPAIRVYQALGFKHRRSLHLAVLKPV